MQYALIKTSTKENELYKLYDEYKQAERKLRKSFSENGKILEIPEIRAGLRLYRLNGNYCYTIVREKKTIWLLDNTEKPEDIYTPVLKENIIKWFVKGAFKDGVEDYDEEYVNQYYKSEDENEEEMLDELIGNESEE